jgi:transcription initiation factor TFIIIB Brf1 subunit/transcription initiation factor TFIIB
LISKRLLNLVRCPDCRGKLEDTHASLTCSACGRVFENAGADFDLKGRDDETTKFSKRAFTRTAGTRRRRHRCRPPFATC